MRPNPDWKFDGSMPNLWINMGNTAENVAEHYNISREDMDKMGVESNRRAYEAIKAGKFKDEIIPIQAFKYKIKNGKRIRETVTFDMDDGVRWPANIEDMAKLKSPFRLGRKLYRRQLFADDRWRCFLSADDSRKGEGIETETPCQNDTFCGCRLLSRKKWVSVLLTQFRRF